VLPALIRRFHEAAQRQDSAVTIWGTGSPRREFLYVDDLAEAALHLMERYSSEDIVNVGVGKDLTILELAHLVARVVGFTGQIETDASKPDGTPRKLLDVERATGLGWVARTELEQGIRETYEWFLSHAARGVQ